MNRRLASFSRETLSQIQAPEARQKIAPDERSESGVRIFDKKEPRQGRKILFGNDFLSPFQGSIASVLFQGFATFTPGYFLVAPSGLGFEPSFAADTS
jgi:hypothetical protein